MTNSNTTTPGYVQPAAPSSASAGYRPPPARFQPGDAEAYGISLPAAPAPTAQDVAGLSEIPSRAAPQAAPAAAPAPAPAPQAPAGRDPYDKSAAAIDNVVNALNAARADLTPATGRRDADMTYNSATDAVQVLKPAPEVPAEAEQLLYDDPSRNLQSEVNSIAARERDIRARLDAHRFDPRTGEKVYEIDGDRREKLQIEADGLRRSGEYTFQRMNAIAAQRAKLAEQGQARSMEEAARAAFTGGNKAKETLLNDAIARVEAERLARAIVDARVAGRGGR